MTDKQPVCIMQRHPRKWLPDEGALTVFTLCFVGGCMDCVSYLLLFHVLLGVMTVNTMIGIIGIIHHTNIHDAILHLSTVAGFLMMVLGHHLAARRKGKAQTSCTSYCLILELVIILAYACIASELHHKGMLREPNIIVFGLVCLGSFAVYLQNTVVPSTSGFPTSTMVMTGNYISLLTHSVNMILSSDEKAKARQAAKHFSLVHAHFWSGVAVMAWATQYFDFLALFVPCLALGLLIWKLKGSTAHTGNTIV
jgi:uncharacterized membrane protein YoaK (UPF0700 family)